MIRFRKWVLVASICYWQASLASDVNATEPTGRASPIFRSSNCNETAGHSTVWKDITPVPTILNEVSDAQQLRSLVNEHDHAATPPDSPLPTSSPPVLSMNTTIELIYNATGRSSATELLLAPAPLRQAESAVVPSRTASNDDLIVPGAIQPLRSEAKETTVEGSLFRTTAPLRGWPLASTESKTETQDADDVLNTASYSQGVTVSRIMTTTQLVVIGLTPGSEARTISLANIPNNDSGFQNAEDVLVDSLNANAQNDIGAKASQLDKTLPGRVDGDIVSAHGEAHQQGTVASDSAPEILLAVVDGKSLLAVGPDFRAVHVEGNTITQGQALTVGDSVFSVHIDNIAVGSNLIPLPTARAIATVAGHTLRAFGTGSPQLLMDNISLERGSVITIDGTIVSAGSNELLVGSKTITLSHPRVIATIAAVQILVDDSNAGQILVDGVPLVPGQATTIAGTVVSAQATAVVVGSRTLLLSTNPPITRSSIQPLSGSRPTIAVPGAGFSRAAKLSSLHEGVLYLIAFLCGLLITR